jgi:hypothetical protein
MLDDLLPYYEKELSHLRFLGCSSRAITAKTRTPNA